MILTEEEIAKCFNIVYNVTASMEGDTAVGRFIEQAILNKLQDKLKNAGRYEWLRNTQKIGKVVCPDDTHAQRYVDEEMFAGDMLDKAIDSAMKGSNL